MIASLTLDPATLPSRGSVVAEGERRRGKEMETGRGGHGWRRREKREMAWMVNHLDDDGSRQEPRLHPLFAGQGDPQEGSRGGGGEAVSIQLLGEGHGRGALDRWCVHLEDGRDGVRATGKVEPGERRDGPVLRHRPAQLAQLHAPMALSRARHPPRAPDDERGGRLREAPGRQLLRAGFGSSGLEQSAFGPTAAPPRFAPPRLFSPRAGIE